MKTHVKTNPLYVPCMYYLAMRLFGGFWFLVLTRDLAAIPLVGGVGRHRAPVHLPRQGLRAVVRRRPAVAQDHLPCRAGSRQNTPSPHGPRDHGY